MRLLIISIFLLILAVYLQMGFFVYATYILMGAILLSYFLTRNSVEKLTVSRICHVEEAEVGDTIEVQLQLENHSWTPIPWLILEDSVPVEALEVDPPKIEIDGPRLTIFSLRPKGKKTLKYKIEFKSRGYYQIGPTMLESGDVFGLTRRYRVVTKPLFIMVYPKVIPLHGYDLASRRPMGEVKMTHRLFEDPSRISGVREYIQGDPLNRIHWKASARTGVLHCKTFEPSTVVGSTIVLEFHKDNYPLESEPLKSDLAVTTAVSIANAVNVLGQQVGFISNGRDAVDRIQQEGWKTEFKSRNAAQENLGMKTSSDRLRPIVVPTKRGEMQFMEIRDTLARIELTDGMPFSRFIDETQNRLVRDATVVVVLGSLNEEIAGSLSDLTAQGYAVTAILVRFNKNELAEAMGRLISLGIETRRVNTMQDISSVCSGQLV